MTLLGGTRVLQAMAATTAIGVARQRPEHRPVALFLAGAVIASAAVTALRALDLAPSSPPEAPLTGAPFFWAHLGAALSLCWPAGLAALSLTVLLRRRAWIVGVVYLAIVIGSALAYPTVRADRRFYLGAELVALLISVGSASTWWWRREKPTLTVSCALLVAGIDLATLIGPYAGDPFRDWSMAQMAYVCLYLALIVVQGGSLWDSRSISRSS
jgi:hypothetical protein